MRRVILFALMALAATALAGPASASASDWTHNGATIEENTTAGLAGNIGFKVPGVGGIMCDVNASLTMTAGTGGKGDIDEFVVNLKSCKGDGFLAACTVTNEKNLEFPWAAEVFTTEAEKPDSADVTIKNVKLENTYGGGALCPLNGTTSVLAFPSVTAKPDNATEISSFTLSGVGKSGENTAEVTGSLDVDVPGTYGIH